jgi:hypothetical protein
MKFIRMTACCLLATPLVLCAEPGQSKPMGRPSGGSSRSTTGRTSDSSTRDGADRGSRGERSREDFEQLRKRMQDFCEKHSPRRWAALEENSHGDKNPFKFGGMFFRFRGLMMLENQDKALYNIKVRQIEIEDEEYGLMKDIREARKTDNTADLNTLTDKLRALSTEYVASRIDERTHRIANLEKTIKAEQTALATEQANQKSLVDQRLDSILNDKPHHTHDPDPPVGKADE